MKLNNILEEILQEWLDSEDHGKKIQQLWGVDGYICVLNFIEYIKDVHNDHEYREYSGSDEPEDSDGY